MLGIALGVAALIVVLSVMNGFQKELRARILGVASHVQIIGIGRHCTTGEVSRSRPRQIREVVAAAPYVMAQGLISNRQTVQGTLVRGILPADEDKVADIGMHMKIGQPG